LHKTVNKYLFLSNNLLNYVTPLRYVCHMYIFYSTEYTGVPCFLSSRPNGLPPSPSPESECCSPTPPLVPVGGTHSLAGEGAGVANSDRRDRHSGTLGLVKSLYLRSTGTLSMLSTRFQCLKISQIVKQ
jgi:hypothetical protein